jgi:hypothetical protein
MLLYRNSGKPDGPTLFQGRLTLKKSCQNQNDNMTANSVTGISRAACTSSAPRNALSAEYPNIANTKTNAA